jgi:penicillin-binding protein 2
VGDTCNVSIGQGALSVTPLQMSVVAAAIANGGDVYRPRLVTEVRERDGTVVTRYPPERIRHVAWPPEAIRVVRGGMRDVVMSETGTGGRARIEGVEMAGKTGTAEYGPKGEAAKHGWMMVFAPVDRPRYAVVMVVDEAVSGGVTVAPRMRQLMQGIFDRAGARG